jgi:hypothetical protein
MAQFIDEPAESTDEGAEETQQETQEATQLSSQEESQDEVRRRYWGYLNPCSSTKKRAYLERTNPVYRVGRAVASNISLKGQKVSACHDTRLSWGGTGLSGAVQATTIVRSSGTAATPRTRRSP